MWKTVLVVLVKASILSLWPLSFVLANSGRDFVIGFLPVLLLLAGLYLSRKSSIWWTVPLLAFGFVDPLLSVFGLIMAGVSCYLKFDKRNLLIGVVALCIFAVGARGFWANSIFVFDEETRQRLMERSYPYNSIWVARIFQNKATVVLEKLRFNFFALVDPNNYFFNFHPREIVATNQNLEKFPFLAVFFFLIGLYRSVSSRDRKFLLIVFGGLLLNLSLLKNFDRHDVALYVPLVLVIFLGMEKVKSVGVYVIFLALTMVQYVHLLVYYA